MTIITTFFMMYIFTTKAVKGERRGRGGVSTTYPPAPPPPPPPFPLFPLAKKFFLCKTQNIKLLHVNEM